MSIQLFVEGGGDVNALRTKCRRAFTKFFEKAGLKGKMPAITACGSRQRAHDQFQTAVKSTTDDKTPFLLIDSESPVNENSSPWQHLSGRPGDEAMVKPDGVNDSQLHLMVQCMEAWFLADVDILENFYSPGFNKSLLPSIPSNSSVEAIAKTKIFEGLKKATRHAKSKGVYGKSAHSFDILALIDPKKVADKSAYAKRLIDTLKKSK